MDIEKRMGGDAAKGEKVEDVALVRVERDSMHGPSQTISMRCHACKQIGTFEVFRQLPDLFPADGVLMGQRRCPNPECHAHIFFIHRHGKPLLTYPAERIDFDTSDIPANVTAALEEAIACHANRTYKAAGMMVRKTLEELCADRKAKGKNLKTKIRALRKKVVMSTELLDAADDLRLLGNDAAHVKSKTYDEVGRDEIEIGIKLTKEILKAVYQQAGLVQELQELKRKLSGASQEG